MGDKVVVDAVVTERPCLEQSPDPVEKEIPCLYPVCAVTRSMSKKKENSNNDITLAHTVIGQVLEVEFIKSSVHEPVKAVAEGSLSDKADKISTPQAYCKTPQGHRTRELVCESCQ